MDEAPACQLPILKNVGIIAGVFADSFQGKIPVVFQPASPAPVPHAWVKAAVLAEHGGDIVALVAGKDAVVAAGGNADGSGMVEMSLETLVGDAAWETSPTGVRTQALPAVPLTYTHTRIPQLPSFLLGKEHRSAAHLDLSNLPLSD